MNLNEKLRLAYLIQENIIYHMSKYGGGITGRLRDSVKVNVDSDKNVSIEIDPQAYDLGLFLNTGELIDIPGSYASKVDMVGGIGTRHRTPAGFAEDGILTAIYIWGQDKNYKVKWYG